MMHSQNPKVLRESTIQGRRPSFRSRMRGDDSRMEDIARSTELCVMVSYRMREMNNQMCPLQPLLKCDTLVPVQHSYQSHFIKRAI